MSDVWLPMCFWLRFPKTFRSHSAFSRNCHRMTISSVTFRAWYPLPNPQAESENRELKTKKELKPHALNSQMSALSSLSSLVATGTWLGVDQSAAIARTTPEESLRL